MRARKVVFIPLLILQPDWDKYHFPPLPTGGLKKLRRLDLGYTQVTDAGCAALAAALDSGTLPALVMLQLNDIPASAAAIDAVTEAVYS